MQAGVRPVAPGVFLARRVLRPQHLTPDDAASAMGLDRSTVHGLLAQEVEVDNNIAQRLAEFTGTTRQFWLNMQAAANKAIR